MTPAAPAGGISCTPGEVAGTAVAPGEETRAQPPWQGRGGAGGDPLFPSTPIHTTATPRWGHGGHQAAVPQSRGGRWGSQGAREWAAISRCRWLPALGLYLSVMTACSGACPPVPRSLGPPKPCPAQPVPRVTPVSHGHLPISGHTQPQVGAIKSCSVGWQLPPGGGGPVTALTGTGCSDPGSTREGAGSRRGCRSQTINVQHGAVLEQRQGWRVWGSLLSPPPHPPHTHPQFSSPDLQQAPRGGGQRESWGPQTFNSPASGETEAQSRGNLVGTSARESCNTPVLQQPPGCRGCFVSPNSSPHGFSGSGGH